MSNENKAIKVQSHNGDSTPLATFHADMSSGPMLRLNSPTELKYTNPPNVESGFMVFVDAFKTLDPELKEFSDKHGFAKFKKLRESLLEEMYNVPQRAELSKYVEESDKEVAEIVHHYTTLMKSSLLEFATEYKALETKLINANLNDAKRKIAKAMKTGEFDE